MRPANDNCSAIRVGFYGLNALGFGTFVCWALASQIAGIIAFSAAFVTLAKIGERRQ